MVARRGTSRLGCLVWLLVFVAVCYFGVNTGKHYFHYYQFKDLMTQEARFAAQRTDDAIRRRLQAFADTLGLPPAARNVFIRRVNNRIFIYCDYYDYLEVPGYVKEVHFRPEATNTF